ncbi:hypothetical protein [Colwellia sp. RSH04]|uniref:hypothetical protein n=1 Tax=Colwellia sp. RSH04 TaxID=2305464 RepID=UPI000E578E74|nr:hypothetical protein [Colwellia sp. RSH04]RHW77809.1 hypothetical protein D1094_02470 [Colwellia sp. RSH04]
MIYLDLSSLNEQLHNECESTFQEKMEASDGTRCMLDASQFSGIMLTKPSLQSQQILCFFANLSCPISMMRFASSLFPYHSKKWPISSFELSQIYMLEAIEVAINLHFDKIAREMVADFQSSREFKEIMLIAHEIVDRIAVPEHICPEVYEFILGNIDLSMAITGRTVQ